jgi:hypothetical protein
MIPAFIPATYQLIALGFAIPAAGLVFTLFARGVFRLVKGYWNV